MNLWILYKLVKEMQRLIAAGGREDASNEWGIQGAGCLMQVFKGAFRMIDRPWKMYPLGVLCEFTWVLIWWSR